MIEMALVADLTREGDENSAILQLFHLLSMGSYLHKFTNHGKVSSLRMPLSTLRHTNVHPLPFEG